MTDDDMPVDFEVILPKRTPAQDEYQNLKICRLLTSLKSTDTGSL